MASKTYTGSCHCKAVSFKAEIDLSKGTRRCNCSICGKARAWFVIVPAKALSVTKGDGERSEYSWVPPGHPKANLHFEFCKTCGVRVFVRGDDDGKGNAFYAIAIPALDDADSDELAKSIIYVDGKHDHHDRAPADIRSM